MATVSFIQKPSTLSLLGNLPDIKIGTEEDVAVVLSAAGKTILSQNYTPGQDGMVTIDLKDVLTPQLSFELKDVAVPYRQTAIAKTFQLSAGTASCEFTVLRAGIDHFTDSAENFLRQNFLTWQPNIKPVTYHTPEFLTYHAVEAVTIKCQVYTPASGSSPATILTLANIPAGETWTIPVQYTIIASKANALPSYYDIWAETITGTRLTYIQRYYATDMKSEEEQWILFENSLGGIDTFRAYGNATHTANHTHNIVEIDDISEEYRVDTKREFRKNSGHLNRKERLWLLDFFPSLGKYIYTDKYLRRIVMTESDVNFTAKELPSQFNFTFRYADAKPYLNLPRADKPAEVLNIQIPDVGSFTLAPRLVELDRLPLSAGALFPVQSPYSGTWSVATAETILEYIVSQISATTGESILGHSHHNLSLLNALSRTGRYLLLEATKIAAGYADEAYTLSEDSPIRSLFLRKDQDDETPYNLGMRNALIREIAQVLKTIVLGDENTASEPEERKLLETYGSVDSMVNGRGTFATNKDRLQTGNLEVRGNMTVMDLIINQLHAMVGEYLFSEMGSIERVVTIDEDSHTYRLYLKKESETSVITLWEGDILYSISNNLLDHKPTDDAYYVHPSWMVANDIDQSHFCIDATLYDDEGLGIVVGTTNFPPEAGFNIARRGSANARVDDRYKERARMWHLSTREGMLAFLDYLYTPVVGDESYQTTVGRLPEVQVLKDWFSSVMNSTPKEHVGVYSRFMFAENFVEINWMGRVVTRQNDRGVWSLETAQSVSEPYRVEKVLQLLHEDPDDPTSRVVQVETVWRTDTVQHLGCVWACNRDKTTVEPSWYSADWTFVSGSRNWNLLLANETRSGLGSADGLVMLLSAGIEFNGFDVTDKVKSQGGDAMVWTRDTGDEGADKTWNEQTVLERYQDEFHTAILLRHKSSTGPWDLGRQFLSRRRCSMTVSVRVPFAEGEDKVITTTIPIK